MACLKYFGDPERSRSITKILDLEVEYLENCLSAEDCTKQIKYSTFDELKWPVWV